MATKEKNSKRDSANIWKLLTSKDVISVTQGLELARLLPDEVSPLLDGLSINERTGEILRNARFEGTKNNQKRLDTILLTLMSYALPGSTGSIVREKVKTISWAVDFVPLMHGFDGLETLELVLSELDWGEEALNIEFDGLPLMGNFPKLRKISITAEGYGQRKKKLTTSVGLTAPSLESACFAGLELTSIEELSNCAYLKFVNLSDNPSLQNIDALKTSAPSLEVVILKGCKLLSSLKPLAGAIKLIKLNLDDCESIDSLKPLHESTLLTHVELSGLRLITSFEGLSASKIDLFDEWKGYSDKELRLFNLSSLKSFSGLPSLDPSILVLNITNAHALKDLTGLKVGPHFKKVDVSGKSLIDISAIKDFPALDSVDIEGSELLEDVSVLGECRNMESVTLVGCSKLKELPAKWSSKLKWLKIRNCDSLKSLGQTPSTIKYLTIAGCASLRSLAGLEKAEELKLSLFSVLLDDKSKSSYIEDASSLEKIQALTINFEPSIAMHGVDDVRPTVFPESLALALKNIPMLNLKIGAEQLKGFSTSIVDVSALAHLKNLQSIDLSSSLYVADLKWLVGLPSVEFVALWPGSVVGKLAGVGTFDSAQEVLKLQARLIKKYSLETPDHIKPKVKESNPSVKAKAKSTSHDMAALKKLLKGDGPSVSQAIEVIKAIGDGDLVESALPDITKALAKLLASTDVEQARQALNILCDFNQASVFDELVDGVDITNVFTGDSPAIGKIFKNVKQPDRSFARWVLINILAAAPADASVAVALRNQFKFIELIRPAKWIDSVPLTLSGFLEAEKVYLRGINTKDLQLLKGMSKLVALNISEAPNLESLAGLEDAVELSKFSFSSCPKLKNFDLLAEKTKLKEDYQGYQLSISPDVGLTDLHFLAGLKSAERIRLQLGKGADTTPMLKAPWINEVDLRVLSWDLNLSGLKYCSNLTVMNWDDEPQSKKISHTWDYDFPKLEELDIRGGVHDLSKLSTSQLKTVYFNNLKLSSLKGIGRPTSLRCSTCDIADMTGIEDAKLTNLDLTNGLYRGLAPIKKIKTLQKLLLNAESSVSGCSELVGCSQISELGLKGFSGSLKFLSGWTSLQDLDLRESGELSDVDTLMGLNSLKTINIRGAKLKKDAWPAQLRDILSTQ
jgi:hypothetical protein